MEDGNDEKDRRYISSLPEFAEIFLFLQIFGPLMKLRSVTLKALEDFFINDDLLLSEEVITIQWRMLRWAGKHGGKEEWQRMAIKFGSKLGLVSSPVQLYQDISMHSRMKIFQRLCEEQFECNMALRNNVSWEEPFYRRTKAVGVDREGRRYWLLQDSAYDVHLYSDYAYADPPTNKSSEMWKLMARSLNDLADHISLLESRTLQPSRSTSSTPTQEDASPEPQEMLSSQDAVATPKTDEASQNARKSSREKGKKSAFKSSGDQRNVVGCLKCLKDVNYKKMLLCDTCDRECHTYCQYPVLWEVPKGEWQCPICKEQQLLKELRQAYLTLSQAKAQHEHLLERKQRSVARLQKSGVLLQNILDDGAEEGRSKRRNRKEINYAELNDLYLPPLSPSELVGRERRKFTQRGKSTRNVYDYIQEDYLAPRIRSSRRRRFSGPSPALDVVVEEEEEVGAGEETHKYMEEEEEEEEMEEEEDKVEEEKEDRSLGEERELSPLAGGATAGLSYGGAEHLPKDATILGKRSYNIEHAEDDCTASSYPPSPDSLLSSSHSEERSDLVSNGTFSTAEVTSVSERCREETWKGEEEGASFTPVQPWTEKEVSESLPQQFLQEPLQSKGSHRGTVTLSKSAIRSVSVVVERSNLGSTLNSKRD